MEVFQSYTGAFQSILETKQFSVAHLHKLKRNMNIDTYGCFKIFYCISGHKHFHIGSQVYPCVGGDLFLVSPDEFHYFSDFSEDEPQERLIYFIFPEYLSLCSSEITPLADCFLHAQRQKQHRRILTPEQQERFLFYFHKLSVCSGFGEDLLIKSAFTELLVFLNKLWQQPDAMQASDMQADRQHSPQVEKILRYIHQNLSADLTGEALAAQFYISPTYLYRIFRSATGTTLHKYITAQRITLAKELLSSGKSVSAVCSSCGFNDYSNFIKAFTKAVGISPKKYGKLSI